MRLVRILSEECREVVSLWAIMGVAAAAGGAGEDNEVPLLVGVGVGMAFINALVHVRPMALLPLMFLASLLSPQLPIATTSADQQQEEQKKKKQMAAAAAVMVAYCLWALPHVLITNLRRLTTMMLMLTPPITPIPMQSPRIVTPARASFQALTLLLVLDIVFVFALNLGVGVKGVAMAAWCFHVFTHVLLNAAVVGDPYQIRLPTPPPTTTTSHDYDDEEDEEDVERWRYNSLVVIAWLLLLPSSPVSSVAAAVSMMRIASFLQTLSVALARCYSHLNVFAVCALGLAQGLLILGMQIALQKWLHYVAAAAAADLYLPMLAIIRKAGPAWKVWAVATGIRSSACVYICHRRGHGHHGGTAAPAMAPVKLLCTCMVGVPVSVLWSFLLDHHHLDVVAGLCYGVAAAQISQAVALTLLMCRQPPAGHIPDYDDDDSVDNGEAGSDVAGVSISLSSSIGNDAPLTTENYHDDCTSCPPSSQGSPELLC